MVDPAYAKAFYADGAFPQLRPRPGEIGFNELGYAQTAAISSKPEAARTATAGVQSWPEITDWVEGWKKDEALNRKFTTFILEESPKGAADGDVTQLLHEGESILQMLQRISAEISAQSNPQDNLQYFEKLNRLFRCGIAPTVQKSLFQGHGVRGYNVRIDSKETADWCGEASRPPVLITTTAQRSICIAALPKPSIPILASGRVRSCFFQAGLPAWRWNTVRPMHSTWYGTVSASIFFHGQANRMKKFPGGN